MEAEDMKIGTKDIITYSRKVLICLIRMTCRLASEHPFVMGMLLFLLTLYIFLPYLFCFLVSSSPIIICTALLLGTLMSFGQPNIPEIEEEEKTSHGLTPLQVSSSAADILVKKDESFCMKSHIENREKVIGTLVKEVNFIEQGDHGNEVQRGVLLSASKEERKDESVGKSSPFKGDKNQILVKKQASAREINGSVYFEKAESCGDALQVAEHVQLETSGEKETENFKVEVHEPTVEGSIDSLDSSQKHVNNHGASSDCSCDCAESSAADASLTEIIPLINEHRPLLDSEASQSVNSSVVKSESVSGGPPQYCKCDGDCVIEKAEHQKEIQDKKDGEAVSLVTWTADDKKNLMDLGPSLLERNRRLENLIAKRRARKNLRVEAETTDELPHIQLRISTVRRNLFDLPYDSEDEFPGSAPSFFSQRDNLFNLSYDQADESHDLAGVSQGHQGSVPARRRELFFRRFESFSVGASFTGEIKRQEHDISLKPYFPTVRETSYADFQRQLSEKSYSNVASESESILSVEDMEHNELVEQELHQESNFELISPCSDVKPVEKEIESSKEVNSLESLCSQRNISICGVQEVDTINISEVFEVETDEAVNGFVENEKPVRHEIGLHSPTSDAAMSDVGQVKHMESSSTSLLEASDTMIEERSTDLQLAGGNYLSHSNDCVHSFISDSDLLNREGESVNDVHVVRPFYDFSPAIGKPFVNIASVEGDLLCGGKDNFNNLLPLASKTQTETSEMVFPRLEKNNILEIGDCMSEKGSTGEMHGFDDEASCLSPSNLSSIVKYDVIQVKCSEVNDKYSRPSESTFSGSAAEQISSSSVEIHLREDNTMNTGVNLQSDDEEKFVVASSDSDVPNTGDYFTSRVSENAHPSLENSMVQTYSDLYVDEEQVNTGLSIPNNPEDFEQEEKQTNPASDINAGFNVSQKMEDPSFNLPKIEQKLFIPLKDPTKGTKGDGVVSKREYVPSNEDTSPGVHIPDGSFSGIGIPTVEAIESSIVSERTKIPKAKLSKIFSTDSNDEVQKRQDSGLPRNSSDASGVCTSVEESLLLEMDAADNFHVEEMSLAGKRPETHCQPYVSNNTASEELHIMESGGEPCEVLLTETPIVIDVKFQ